MDANQFGEFVQQCRKELGLTQSDLAEKIHVTAKAVSRWERGVGFPDIKLLQPLADALEISLVELMQSRRIPEELTLKAADPLVTQTVTAIQDQQNLSRRQKSKLILGNVLLGIAYIFLFVMAQQYPFEPKWLGLPLLIIAVFGFHYGRSALTAIVTGTKFVSPMDFPEKMTAKHWLFAGLFVAGLAGVIAVLIFMDSANSLRDLLVVLGLGVCFAGGLLFYAVD